MADTSPAVGTVDVLGKTDLKLMGSGGVVAIVIVVLLLWFFLWGPGKKMLPGAKEGYTWGSTIDIPAKVLPSDMPMPKPLVSIY